jgi:transposase
MLEFFIPSYLSAVEVNVAADKKRRIGLWSTEQVNDMIVEESGIQYHYTHVYRLLHKWGFKQKVPRKVHVNTASEEEKEQFKKEHRKY